MFVQISTGTRKKSTNLFIVQYFLYIIIEIELVMKCPKFVSVQWHKLLLHDRLAVH